MSNNLSGEYYGGKNRQIDIELPLNTQHQGFGDSNYVRVSDFGGLKSVSPENIPAEDHTGLQGPQKKL